MASIMYLSSSIADFQRLRFCSSWRAKRSLETKHDEWSAWAPMGDQHVKNRILDDSNIKKYQLDDSI